MTRRGFSTVELAVTLVVLAIIAAIAVPSYQAWRSAAAISTAEQLLTGVSTYQLKFAQTWGGYTSYVGSYPEQPSDFEVIPGSLILTTGEASTPDTVSIAVGTSGTAVMATTATNGTCVTATMAPVAQGGRLSYSTASGTCDASVILGVDTPVNSTVSRTW